MLPTGSAVDRTSSAGAQVAPASVGEGFTVSASDLAFILKQIKISERHAATLTPANPCGTLVGPNADQIPDRLSSYGLRTVDGSCNNLIPGREKFATADELFPRITNPVFKAAESNPPLFGPPGPTASYAQTTGSVFDSQPRVISNLIVDQTSTNPAAVAAAEFPVRTQNNPGLHPCTSDPDLTVDPPVPGVPAGCVPSHQTLFIPNVTTDVGLSPPYNSLFTIFGQFFDHGLDKITNGGNGTVFVPLKADDPLIAGPDHVLGNGDDLPPQLQFMVLTRGTVFAGPGKDGIAGTADDTTHETQNTDSPWVDLSQAYASHPAHQVFLREYSLVGGRPRSTGKLLSSPDGSMANWAVIKSETATKLGLQLVDNDVNDVPLVAADPYGNFIPGPLRGMPQWVTTTGLVEGNLAAPVAAPANVRHAGAAFLNDIAHSAVPVGFPDADSTAGLQLDTPVCTVGQTPCYDNELLDLHVIAGDGRANENIGLTSIHTVFEHEHNRLVADIQNTLNANPALLADYQAAHTLGTANISFGYGERLFQAARFVTEMEYQHLVFEEFGRKVQPLIDPFHIYHTEINPAITAEFAHAVYRFGHSMLDDTIPRKNVDGTENDIPLLDGFLNPAAFKDVPAGDVTANGGDMGAAGAGAIIMGLSDQTGNELDEFIADTLRNNLLGLPLDLGAINMTRARSEGVPPLNEVRRQIHAATNDGSLAPYTSWYDFGTAIKHPESLVNFVAAYGLHPSIVAETTTAGKRAAARAIVDPLPTDNPPADAAAFMFGTDAWANTGTGVTTTGVDNIDLWVGGLAERTNLFGGLLGPTFNYVFEEQLTNLQNGDRLYYLNRTPGMNLRPQLEGNSFAELIMRNTSAHSLKADSFATADCKFELSNLHGTAADFTALGPVVADDPASECNETELLTRVPSGRIEYKPINSVDTPGINGQAVYNGSNGVDLIKAGNDNDTILGNDGNDVLEGYSGDDITIGGNGDDIITDFAGDDVPKGGPGNDAIDSGPGLDILMGGDGNDFTNAGLNDNETFAGAGTDFVNAGAGADAVFGDAGDDWIQGGTGQDLLQGDHGAPFFDDPAQTAPGNDVFIGQVGENDNDAEGGDDLMAQYPAVDRNAGAGGFDWAFHQYDTVGADDDMAINNFLAGIPIQIVVNRDRWQETEADSGSAFNDLIKGTEDAPIDVAGAGFTGCNAIDQAGINRIAGLSRIMPPLTVNPAAMIAASAPGFCPVTGNVWGAGNILLGGAGSDSIEGRGADDIIDGDHFVNVRISVRAGVDANGNAAGAEIGTTDLMEHTFQTGNPMTLAQAVFAGIVNPGQLVITREMLPLAGAGNTNTAADCAAASPVNCDVAVFSGARAEYVISRNANGSITVDHQGGVDGIDTLWNIERLQFSDQTILTTAVGPVAPATAVVTPAGTLGFGIVTVGTVAPRTVTVTNTGGGTTTITGATITGAQAGQFSILNNGCTTLGAGGSCTIDVSFSPTTASLLRTATLAITTSAGTRNVTMTGTAIAAAILAQASIAGPTDFGTRRVGEPRTQAIRVTNTGGANLNVTGVVFTGPFTGDRGTCNVAIAPGATCRINVTFNPAGPFALKSGTVRLTSNASNTNVTATLTGTSRAAAVAVAALRIVQPVAPTSVRPVNVSLRVSTAATVRVQVRRANGQLVWSKVTKVKKAGASSVRWNLRDSKGHKVKKGSYRFTITVTDASGAKVVVKKSVRVR